MLAHRIVTDLIEAGHLPGTMLPSEKEMLAQYQISRSTLREALRYLEMQGVLRLKPGPGGGPQVSLVDSRPLASTLALLLELEGTPFRAVLEVRETLEPTLAARAALRRDDEDLSELADSIAALVANHSNPKRVALENSRFHKAIAVCAGNQVLEHFVNSLNWIIDGTALGVYFPEPKVDASVKAHQRIYEAILAQDTAGAAAAMEVHLNEFSRFLEKNFASVLDQPLRWADADY